jgi:hypothetical protein
MWCVTEFASALGIKQGAGQMMKSDALSAWQHFERLSVYDLQLFNGRAFPLFTQRLR